MKNNKKVWEKIFKDKGRFFEEPNTDMLNAAKLMHKREIKKIYDLGCGTGRHTVFFAKHGFEVYGTDISESGIKSTGNWLKKEGLRANLKKHDMTKKFPFKDNFFDAIVSVQVIHHAPVNIIKKIIKEIERILKKGGFILITVPKYTKYDPDKHGWKMKKIDEHTYLPLDGLEKGMIHYYFTPLSLRNAFNKFKIKKIYVDDTNHLSLWAFKK